MWAVETGFWMLWVVPWTVKDNSIFSYHYILFNQAQNISLTLTIEVADTHSKHSSVFFVTLLWIILKYINKHPIQIFQVQRLVEITMWMFQTFEGQLSNTVWSQHLCVAFPSISLYIIQFLNVVRCACVRGCVYLQAPVDLCVCVRTVCACMYLCAKVVSVNLLTSWSFHYACDHSIKWRSYQVPFPPTCLIQNASFSHKWHTHDVSAAEKALLKYSVTASA